MFSLHTGKEKTIFNNKLSKLVTLVRKASSEDKVDALVYDIDHELKENIAKVKKQLRIVRTNHIDAE